MWTFVQLTGRLSSGAVSALGYSGKDEGQNNPVMQDAPFVGPIPCGLYTILPPQNSDTKGPFVLWLEPDPTNEMFGRYGFGIHGDSKQEPGTASEGCIIMPRMIREAVWNSGDHLLEVVSGTVNKEEV